MFSKPTYCRLKSTNPQHREKLISSDPFEYEITQGDGPDINISGYSCCIDLNGKKARLIVEHEKGTGISIELLPIVDFSEEADPRGVICHLQEHLIKNNRPSMREIAKRVCEHAEHCFNAAGTSGAIEQVLIELQKEALHGCPSVSIIDLPLEAA